ncbi:MAG: hypothetical protein PHV34_02385 [Verrucomicrobiae bacterium]|nr:hypothetical protein [Verrucomicrobiae bacterium]
MKSIQLAVLALCFSAFALARAQSTNQTSAAGTTKAPPAAGVTNAPPPAINVPKNLKLKVRWNEKRSKEKKRIITVSIKNDGFEDLNEVDALIVLKGKVEKQRQTEKVKLEIPKGKEVRREITVEDAEVLYLDASILIKAMGGVDVIIGDLKFSS